MNFKVSKNFKGSCVLPTLKKAIWSEMSVSITGNDLRADDIKEAVRRGILIPEDDSYNIEEIKKDHDVIINNNTNQVLVLGKFTLRANGSLLISKDDAKVSDIISAAEGGFITIESDEGDAFYIKKKVVNKTIKKTTKKDEQIEEIINIFTPESGEDKKPTALTWDFQAKDVVEAIKIPKTEDFIKVGEDEKEDIDFVDDEEDTIVDVKKRKTKKKASEKRISTNKETKKKEITAKSKKVKTLQPAGEKRLPKTQIEAAVELDSRGNPLCEKPGDIMQHLIDSVNSVDVDFVDDEQDLDRYKNRTDME